MTDTDTRFDSLAAIVGVENLLLGEAVRPFATDVYRELEMPSAVVRPTSVAALQAVIAQAGALNLNVAVRGGGASYTDGYLARDAKTVLIDMGGLDKIVEINEVDNYVTVEAGCTWATLRTKLAERDLRTPFWGPFSGLVATVGGSVSQNSISHGSGAYGISAQSVQAMDVVLADGSIMRTGSSARGGKPFARHFGPDLSGLFTGDCGAFGVKARITLPLLRRRPSHRNVSFAFPTFEAMHEAMRLVALERLEDSHFAIDAALSQGQIARQDRAGGSLAMARQILRSSPSFTA
ncbi:MAG: FAD-binding oxidoreductase, partial [Caulobacteraceae bacterium]